MKPKVIITSTDGFEVFGYIESDLLTCEQLDALGIPANNLENELLEVEGYDDEGGKLWVYNGNRGIQVEVDNTYLQYAIEEYVAFHPTDTAPDIYRAEEDYD